jgi:hypothetical protein
MRRSWGQSRARHGSWMSGSLPGIAAFGFILSPWIAPDIRLKNGFRIQTGPVWAYREHPWRPWEQEPDPAAWRNILRTLQRRADADYKRRLADHQATLEWRRSFGLRPVEPTPYQVGPPWHSARWPQQQCRVCRQEFFGAINTRYCSRACYRQRPKAPRPSRAKWRDFVACPVCQETFQPTRNDALFCSVRCRVAAHRARQR